MQIDAHRRRRDVREAPEAERAARRALHGLARHAVKAAQALAEIEKSRAYVLSGCASVLSWAAACGYGPVEARRLLALGRTFRVAPELVEKVRSAKVTVESAVSVGKVLLDDVIELTAGQRADWLRKAEELTPEALREEVDKAREEARQGAATVRLRLEVTREARDGFHRARLLMSSGQPRWVTEGQTFGRLVQDWLERNDPRKGPLPKRRRGPTAGTRDRYVPARVRAQVLRRSGGMCEICCVRRGAEFIHVKARHAAGGGREVGDLAYGCPECHVFEEAGIFRFSHFDEDGRPHWTFRPGPLGREGDGSSEVRERPPVEYVAVRRSRAPRGPPIRAGPGCYP